MRKGIRNPMGCKIPSILLTPYVGILVEKVSKKHAIVLSDYCSGALFCLLAVLLFAGNDSIVVFSIISAGYVFISNVLSVSSSVLFTEITDDENRLAASGKKSLVESVTSLASPALGTILFSFIGMRGIALINAVAFTASATAEIFIEYHGNHVESGENWMGIRDYREVFSWLGSHGEVIALLLTVMVLNFFVAPNEEVIFPGILLDKYAIPSAYYGISTTLFVAGSLAASLLITITKKYGLA